MSADPWNTIFSSVLRLFLKKFDIRFAVVNVYSDYECKVSGKLGDWKPLLVRLFKFGLTYLSCVYKDGMSFPKCTSITSSGFFSGRR